MQRIAIIPARYASTRLPGKPLLDICGKPMLLRVYEQAMKASLDQVIIATDDQRIYQQMSDLGCEIRMTSTEHRSGTDRLAEVIESLQLADDDIVINVQGDEPLIPPEVIDQVADLLIANPDAVMSTLSTPILDVATLGDPNVVKVLSNDRGEALYFSRAPIPCKRGSTNQSSKQNDQSHQLSPLYQRHIGIYSYRAAFLSRFSQWQACELELIESLEQLRVLWHGEKIQVAEAVTVPAEGIDTQEDLDKIRSMLSVRN